MAYDKDKPAASTSLRQSNPEILANNTALESAIDNEHSFATLGDQSGDHTQGSARCFWQAGNGGTTEPATRIDGNLFTSTDLGSLWVDTDDNAFYILTAITPTWTPVSDEVISTLLGSPRTFLDTLSVTGNFDVNTDKFTVNSTTGNTIVSGDTTVSGKLDVTGNIDPTTYETTNGGFLDENDLASDSATSTASQQSIKAFASLDPDGVIMHDAEGGLNNCDVNGTKTKVYTKYLTGTLDGSSSPAVAHGVANATTKILSVTAWAFDDSISKFRSTGLEIRWDSTDVRYVNPGSSINDQAYRIAIDYTL